MDAPQTYLATANETNILLYRVYQICALNCEGMAEHSCDANVFHGPVNSPNTGGNGVPHRSGLAGYTSLFIHILCCAR